MTIQSDDEVIEEYRRRAVRAERERDEARAQFDEAVVAWKRMERERDEAQTEAAKRLDALIQVRAEREAVEFLLAKAEREVEEWRKSAHEYVAAGKNWRERNEARAEAERLRRGIADILEYERKSPVDVIMRELQAVLDGVSRG